MGYWILLRLDLWWTVPCPVEEDQALVQWAIESILYQRRERTERVQGWAFRYIGLPESKPRTKSEHPSWVLPEWPTIHDVQGVMLKDQAVTVQVTGFSKATVPVVLWSLCNSPSWLHEEVVDQRYTLDKQKPYLGFQPTWNPREDWVDQLTIEVQRPGTQEKGQRENRLAS